MLIQYVATAFILLIIIQLIIKLIKDRLAFLKISIWVFFWCLVLFFVWFPEFMLRIAELLGVGRGVDVLIYVSLIFLFYLVFNQNSKIDKLNKEITKLVRVIARNEEK
jgi:small membrane protein